jgi:hypothetical protein
MADDGLVELPEGVVVEKLEDGVLEGVRVGGWRIETAARRGILNAPDMERCDHAPR